MKHGQALWVAYPSVGHSDTHQTHVEYVLDMPRGMSLTRYEFKGFGQGQDMIKIGLDIFHGFFLFAFFLYI